MKVSMTDWLSLVVDSVSLFSKSGLMSVGQKQMDRLSAVINMVLLCWLTLVEEGDKIHFKKAFLKSIYHTHTYTYTYTHIHIYKLYYKAKDKYKGEAEALPVEVSDDIFENFIVHRMKFSHYFLQHLQSLIMIYNFWRKTHLTNSLDRSEEIFRLWYIY